MNNTEKNLSDNLHTVEQHLEKIQGLINAIHTLERLAGSTHSIEIIKFEIYSVAKIAQEAERCLNSLKTYTE